LVFAIVVNLSEQPAANLRRGIDQMVMAVHDWAENSPPDQWGNCAQATYGQALSAFLITK
jgi:hypothetical protein